MKHTAYFLLALLGAAAAVSCSDDEWSNNNPAMEHVYYYGFQDWGKLKNDLKYTVAQGDTIGLTTQFWSEYTRSYDVTSYYYTVSTLKAGTDYEIVDAAGRTLSPNAEGAYEMMWPQARKGVQKIYLKALRGTTGSVVIQTFNPNDTAAISNTYTVNHITPDYEVHTFTQNYKVTVNIK